MTSSGVDARGAHTPVEIAEAIWMRIKAWKTDILRGKHYDASPEPNQMLNVVAR